MGERGPQPKRTAEQNALLGNPNRERIDAPPSAPIAPEDAAEYVDVLTDVPDAPDWLAGKKGTVGVLALQAWASLAPLLVQARQLRQGDEISLARYCRYVSEWVVMTDDIDDMGMILIDTGPKGGETTKANPLLRARASLETAISGLEKELGLNPKARIEVQKRIMQYVKDLPQLGGRERAKPNGAVGFLNRDDDDE